MVFSLFERLLDPFLPALGPPPPPALLAFYLHHLRQARGLVAALFVCGLLVALLDVAVPVIISHLVKLIGLYPAAAFFPRARWQLLGFAGLLLFARPAALLLQSLVTYQAIAPGLTSRVRWQSHWHLIRQDLPFFYGDYAGRIGNRVMQTGAALRESLIQTTNSAWYIAVYAAAAIVLLSRTNRFLVASVAAWCGAYVVFLFIFLPILRRRSAGMSAARAILSGLIVDTYTNILTVKLFGRTDTEDELTRRNAREHIAAMQRQMRTITTYSLTLALLNAAFLVGTGALALKLWVDSRIGLDTVALVLPVAWHMVGVSSTVAVNLSSIFDNVGTVQDGMKSIAVEAGVADPPEARGLVVQQGRIDFRRVCFRYGGTTDVIDRLDLSVAPGEHLGLLGPSGAGKSTVIHLLARLYPVQAGRILIDGQDIAAVTQESLRRYIGLVAQETGLLNRSVRDNIAYGLAEVAEESLRDAAMRAEALAFIDELRDSQGRRGFDAHVGERGIHLSGGQRQRIALARVFLRKPAIVLLDEATASLDPETEAAVYAQLHSVMAGRTVISISHRLSTLVHMDRLIMLEEGCVAASGSHAQLLLHNRRYAQLWARQSGGAPHGTLREQDRALHAHNSRCESLDP